MLRALILTRDDDSGRHVRDANGRVGRVYVLAARARRAVGVNAQVLLVYLDLDVLVNLGRDEERGERSLARARAEGRYANEAVDARLRREKAVRVLAFDPERRALDARLLSRLEVQDLCLEAALLGPLQIHAQEHLGPVLRVRPARARLHSADSIARVVRAREEHL